MAAKVQSQLLVASITRDRADALSLVIEVARAEVYRMALEGAGLTGLEKTYATQLRDLEDLASGMGMGLLELAARAVADGYTLADLRGRKRYPARR